MHVLTRYFFNFIWLFDFFQGTRIETSFALEGYTFISPLVQIHANVKDSENADRWLAALSSSIVH